MKKLNFLKMMLLAVVMMAGSVAWGQEMQKLTESFETGLPTGYSTTTTYTLNSGTWTGQANGVIRGTTGAKSGNYSLQLRSQTGAQITTPTIAGGVTKVVFWGSGSTASSAVQVRFSTDNGVNWTQAVGSPFSLTTGVAVQKTATINSTSENILVQFYRTAGTVFVDDIEIFGQDLTTTSIPTFFPLPGTYTSAQSVTLSSETTGAKVYYTTDGVTVPTNASTAYVAGTPINVAETTTIKAIAYDADGANPSAVAEGTYTIKILDPNNPYELDDSTPLSSLDEKFEGGSLPATWTNIALQGEDKNWAYTTYSGNSYMQMSAFGGTGAYQTLLISPAINFDAISKNNVTFDLKAGYANGATLKVYVMSKDGTKTEVKSITATVPTTGYAADFTTETLDLSAYSGTKFLVFEYNGDVAQTQTTTYQVDNILMLPNAPVILTTPESLAFEAELNATSTAQTVEITGSNLTASPTYEITGTDAAHFAVTGTLTTDGGTLNVTFTPTTEGNKTANLVITSGTVSKTVALSGTVKLPKVPSVVISQVYGGGGNSGAFYKNDFIELYNPTTEDVDLTGWTVQYASATGSFSTTANYTELAGTIKSGKYFLIQQAAGNGGTADLPTPDAIGAITMGGANFKVALANNTEKVTEVNGVNVIDFVGTGTANQYEGTGAAPAGSNSTSVIRKDNGNQDTDDNAADFEAGTPAPRNSQYPLIESIKDGNWNDDTTWSIGKQPTGADYVEISHLVTIKGTAEASTLTIQPTGKLTIGELDSQLITDNLIINSDATGTGTLVGNYSGSATVNQHIAEKRTYYMGSPVNTLTAVSGIDNIATFDIATDKWSALEVASKDNIPTGGKGFLAQAPLGTATFTGLLNNGDIEISLLQSEIKNYNYYGNPYPSYLNSSKVLSGGTTDGTIWQRTKGGTGFIFVTYNNADGGFTLPSGYDGSLIAPMQGFWVNAVEAGTFTFNNDMREHKSGEAMFKAPRAFATSQRILLAISNGTTTDEALVRFNEGAGTGVENWDSRKMMNAADALNIFTVDEGVNLAINSYPAISYNTEIPVGINVVAGNYTISAKEFSGFAEENVVNLIDTQEGKVTDLTKGDYSFTLGANLNSTSRFALVFPKSDVPTGLGSEEFGSTTILIRDNQIVVHADESLIGASVHVYNGVGQRVASQNISDRVNVLNGTFAKGVYVVNINNFTQKVIIK